MKVSQFLFVDFGGIFHGSKVLLVSHNDDQGILHACVPFILQASLPRRPAASPKRQVHFIDYAQSLPQPGPLSRRGCRPHQFRPASKRPPISGRNCLLKPSLIGATARAYSGGIALYWKSNPHSSDSLRQRYLAFIECHRCSTRLQY